MWQCLAYRRCSKNIGEMHVLLSNDKLHLSGQLRSLPTDISHRANGNRLSPHCQQENVLWTKCLENHQKDRGRKYSMVFISIMCDNATPVWREIKNWKLLFFQIFPFSGQQHFSVPKHGFLCHCNVWNWLCWAIFPRISIPISFWFVFSLDKSFQVLWKGGVKQ